jgi:transposase
MQLEPLVAALPAVAGRRGRPRCRSDVIQGDRAYWSTARHARLAARASSPWWRNRGVRLGVLRWVVERTLAWLHRSRRLALRYEHRADVHEAFLTLGCTMICWNYLKAPRRVF